MSAWKCGAGLAMLAVICSTGAMATPAEPVVRRDAAAVSRVPDANLVCMVNDRYMGVEQIPVQVEGRTYYGCCEMCKTRLAQDRDVRQAVDPVSGKTVDKAMAVIGRRADGTVLYFESATTLAKYIGQNQPGAGRPK
jgi:YHS domain-containing protein